MRRAVRWAGIAGIIVSAILMVVTSAGSHSETTGLVGLASSFGLLASIGLLALSVDPNAHGGQEEPVNRW